MAAPNVVAPTYKPRAAFIPFHQRHQRYAVLVCHRRAGKTVSTVNDIVDKAIRFPHIPEKPGKFGYVAPYKTQARDAAWRYFKAAVKHIPGAKVALNNPTGLAKGAAIGIPLQKLITSTNPAVRNALLGMSNVPGFVASSINATAPASTQLANALAAYAARRGNTGN